MIFHFGGGMIFQFWPSMILEVATNEKKQSRLGVNL